MNNEAEGYAASLRQQACWIIRGRHTDLDECELCAAADFIERQQAEIEALKHDIERHIAIISAEVSSGGVVMNAFAIVRALLRTKRAIVKELRQLQELHVIDRKLDDLLHRQTQLENRIMDEIEELKANQAETLVLVGKVKVDVETLHALVASIPPAGMTPEQKAGLTEALAQSAAIKAALAGVDAMTADPTAPVEPAPVEPAPTEPTA